MSTFSPIAVTARVNESAVVRSFKKKVKKLQEDNPDLSFTDAQKIVKENEKAKDKKRLKKGQDIQKAAADKAKQNLGLTTPEAKDKSEDKPKTKSKPKPKAKDKGKVKLKRTMSGFKPVREKSSFTKKTKSSTVSKTKETPKAKTPEIKDDPKDIFGTPKSKRDAVVAKRKKEIMERRKKKKEKDNKEKPKKKKFTVGRR